MRRFWIFNHYATTPLTGPLLRHFYFAEYLKEKGIETTVFAANELHQTGGCVDTHGKPYLRTEEEGVPFVLSLIHILVVKESCVMGLISRIIHSTISANGQI